MNAVIAAFILGMVEHLMEAYRQHREVALRNRELTPDEDKANQARVEALFASDAADPNKNV